MSSPFAKFRKNQKKWMAFLGVACMVSFVFGGITCSGDGVPQGGQIVVSTSQGNFTEAALSQLVQARNNANRFMAMAYQSTGIDPRFVPREVFGPPSEEVVLINSLIADRAEKMGVRITDTVVNDFIRQQTEGKLSDTQINYILKELGVSAFQLYSSLRRELAAQELLQRFTSAVAITPPSQRWDYYLRLHQRANVEVLPVSVASFASQVPDPSASEIEDFFEEHKNTTQSPMTSEPGFAQPPRIAIEAIKANFQKFYDEAEKTVTDEDIKKYYEEHLDEFPYMEISGADFLNSHGLIPSDDKTDTENKDPEKKDPEKTGDEAEKKQPETKEPEKAPEENKTPETPTPDKPEPNKTDPEKPAAPDSKPEPKDETPTAPQAEKNQPESNEQGRADLPSDDVLALADGNLLLAQNDPAATDDKPAADKTTDDKTADKSADDKTADDKTADDKPATDEPAEDTGEEKKPEATPPGKTVEDLGAELMLPTDVTSGANPEHDPLWKVEARIRETLTRQRANEKIEEGMSKIQQEMEEYASRWLDWDAQRTDETYKEPEPQKPNLKALSEKYGFALEPHTNLETPFWYRDTELGKATVDRNGFDQSFLSVAFFGLRALQPAVATAENGDKYLFWKVREMEQYVPDSIDDNRWTVDRYKGYVPEDLTTIKDQVIRSWKMVKAREVAKKKAEEIAADVAKSDKPLTETTLNGETGKEIPAFTWMTAPTAPSFQGPQQPQLSEVEGVDQAGPDFMKEVFSLKDGSVGTAFNESQSIVYVIKRTGGDFVLGGTPIDNPELVRTLFMSTGQQTYQPLIREEIGEQQRSLSEQITQTYKVDWKRPPRVLR